MMPFNKPPLTGNEQQYVLQAMQSGQISGGGVFGQQCEAWFEQYLSCEKALLTPSCTAALEMAAMLIDIQPGDEVIMPSYTFVSTANAFVLRGAKIVFVDIEPGTMNIDANLIEAAVTTRTKAIVPVHYAGVGCDMDTIMKIANDHNLYVIEDAAQAMTSTYNHHKLGTVGHLAAYSFHETKNYSSGGEGGLLIVNDKRFVEGAEIIREKGTNRNQFFRGEVNKYTWQGIGSSYLLSELQAAFLWGQLEQVEEIRLDRLNSCLTYQQAFEAFAKDYQVTLPSTPESCEGNGHMYYLKLKDLEQRGRFIHHLKERDIMAVFHYVPLHSAPAGIRHGSFHGTDQYTTKESERLVRLPLYYGMTSTETGRVVEAAAEFLNNEI